MARHAAIAATGETVVRFLKSSFPAAGGPVIEQVTTRMFSQDGNPQSVTSANGGLTLLLYRVDVDATQRQPISWTKTADPTAPAKRYALGVELRYLVTAWADEATMQQLVLGRAMSALAAHATFAAADLVDAIGGVTEIWRPEESFQFVPDELGTEDLYQLWESLGRQYELSVPFKARGVRLEADLQDGAGPVFERDLAYGTFVPDTSSTGGAA